MIARILSTPLGDALAAAEDGALCGLWFIGQRHFPADAPGWPIRPDPSADAVFDAARAWLDAYFAGEEPAAMPALAPRGTDFQQKVWAALREIPLGQTTSYAALALRCGSAPRAVGNAVGRNPISVLIPCHRVLGSGGSLTGYAGGLDRKQALLKREGVIL